LDRLEASFEIIDAICLIAKSNAGRGQVDDITLSVEGNNSGRVKISSEALASIVELARETLADNGVTDEEMNDVPDWRRMTRAWRQKWETAFCIGSDMSIVGKIEYNGPVQVLGRIEGELRASDVLISDGAQLKGNVIAQAITVCGRVKGTIRADRVKLQNGGAVEGDIFHRTLSIDENFQFKGSSRPVENPTEPSSSADAKGPQKDPQGKHLAPAPVPSIDA
jgi:cytoskeletal protein CcmA (bactofilin family)